MEFDKDLRSRQEARALISAAEAAHQQLKSFEQAMIDRIVEAIAQAGSQNAELLGRMACEETGFGNARDKAEKNRFASNRVYEAIKDLKTVGILRKEDKRWDIGVSVGVIAGIVPSTNPTSTVIYKSMIALKAGNPIVFSPHPGAVKCTLKAAQIVAEAACRAGCPQGAIGCISTPTMDAVNELMRHKYTRLILATGGGAMVRAAYSSGKPAIGVGAGNGPAYIHKSANIAQAVRDIIRSKTFDNGTICASEQSVIVEECCAKTVLEEFQHQGAHLLSEEEAARLAKFILRADGTMNPKIVGKTAHEIAQLAGICVPGDTTVLIAPVTQAGLTSPYCHEKLCPVLAFFAERDENAVLQRCVEVLLGEGAGHTFAIHANDEAVIRRFALEIPVSRFLVNTPASLGGVGYSTQLFPALTLGCGAVGGSSSSNNIGPLDLINIRRVAWGSSSKITETTAFDASVIDALTEEILKKLR